MGYPQPLSAADRAVLESVRLLSDGKGTVPGLDPVFEEAGRVLLNPCTNLTIRLLAPADELQTNVQLPGTTAEGGGVALNRIGDRYRVKWPVSALDLHSLLHEWFLAAVAKAPGHSFQALLDPLMATALFGVADLLRATTGLSVDRPEQDGMVFDAERLTGFLAGAEAGTGIEDLRLYAALAAGRTATATGSELGGALARLVEAGQLERNGSGYRAAGALAVLGSPVLQPERALHWHQVSLPDAGEMLVRSRVAVQLGRDLLLVLDATEHGVLLRAPSGAELAGDFREELGWPVVNPDVSQASAGWTCPSCRVRRSPEARFCTKCGAEAPSPARAPRPEVPGACPKCTAPIKMGAGFCTKCGAGLAADRMKKPGQASPLPDSAARTQASAGWTCPNCSVRLSPEARFCTKCGAEAPSPSRAPRPEVPGACPKCTAPIKVGAGFCTRCGAVVGALAPESLPRPRSCSSCGARLKPNASYCTICGTRG